MRQTAGALVSLLVGALVALGAAAPAQAVRAWGCTAVLPGADALPAGVRLVAVVGGQRSEPSPPGEPVPSWGDEPDETIVVWSQEGQDLTGYTWLALTDAGDVALPATCEISIDPGVAVEPQPITLPAAPSHLQIHPAPQEQPSHMSYSFLQSATDASDLTTYTFASQNLGTPSAGRRIIVALSSRVAGTTPTTITSVTVGGVAATIVVQAQGTGNGNTCISGLAIAAVPSGSTGDIVVTYSRGMVRSGIGVYWTDVVSLTPYATGSDTGLDPEASLDIPAGGFAIGALTGGTGGSAPIDWINLTEHYETIYDATLMGGASESFASAQTGLTLTADQSLPTTDTVAVFASWGDVAAVGQPLVRRFGGVPHLGTGGGFGLTRGWRF